MAASKNGVKNTAKVTVSEMNMIVDYHFSKADETIRVINNPNGIALSLRTIPTPSGGVTLNYAIIRSYLYDYDLRGLNKSISDTQDSVDELNKKREELENAKSLSASQQNELTTVTGDYFRKSAELNSLLDTRAIFCSSMKESCRELNAELVESALNDFTADKNGFMYLHIVGFKTVKDVDYKLGNKLYDSAKKRYNVLENIEGRMSDSQFAAFKDFRKDLETFSTVMFGCKAKNLDKKTVNRCIICLHKDLGVDGKTYEVTGSGTKINRTYLCEVYKELAFACYGMRKKDNK